MVDAEEEFDWKRDFDRNAVEVSAIRELPRAQELFDEYGVRTTYVTDYPVAVNPESAAVMRELGENGHTVIGAHLHPWVTPPYVEDVNAANSYPGNLPPQIEREKLIQLCLAIEKNIGQRARVYQAGRYGFGPNTAEILAECGFEVDFSPCPPFDFGADGGPDYSHFPADPFWFGEGDEMLALPTTGAYIGYLHRSAQRVYRLATHPSLRWAKLPGVLSRLGALDRLRLSPEGYSFSDMRRLTSHLLRTGVRVLTLSFHAPTLKPGCTEYVRNERDRDAFLDCLRQYCDYFMNELGGTSCSPLELKAELAAMRQAPVPPVPNARPLAAE